MLLAEITEAVRLVLTQFLLQNLKFGIVEGQYVLAPASAFWLFTASALYVLYFIVLHFVHSFILLCFFLIFYL